MGTTHFLLIRHGETEWNRVERFRGRADIELNSTGVAQAEAIARRLRASDEVSAVYSSPLKRAVATAAPIADAFGLRVQGLPDLVDIDYGEWQGLTPADAEQRDPDVFQHWLETPAAATIPGGETLDAVRARSFAALQGAIARHPGQTIALVSHRVVCKVLACAILGLDNNHFWRIEQHNAAVNRFIWGGAAFTIVSLNDTCHLVGIGGPAPELRA